MPRLRDLIVPLRGIHGEFDPLFEAIAGARLVLIGEASHGTHDFYDTRARITKHLIAEYGFAGVAAEADWPDAYRLNRYVQGRSADRSAEAALGDFRRFPQWMWRNTVVRDFGEWLREYNDCLGGNQPKPGFYGMDLYSMHASADAVIRYLDKVDPEAARRARYRYGCFEDFREDTQGYGYATGFGMSESCEKEVVDQLVELQRRALDLARRDGLAGEDDFFSAEQNARLVTNSEEYYRTMFRGRVSSWNLRDKHMADTVDSLLRHLDKRWGRSKLVLWAHNSHLGDASATEMGRMGEWNVGQLVRERYPGECFSVGFTTYTGTVRAADDWDEPDRVKTVRPGLRDSYEELFHNIGVQRFLLLLKGNADATAALGGEKLQRAIGVIYRPESERLSHYFSCDLARQFDAVIHIDESRALEPLRAVPEVHVDAPETYPAGV